MGTSNTGINPDVMSFVYYAMFAVYMLPSIIAWRRNTLTWGLFCLNFFLGVSGIGWIAAFILAVSGSKPVKYTPRPQPQTWTYSCGKCAFQKSFDQKLLLYKCPQCGEENTL